MADDVVEGIMRRSMEDRAALAGQMMAQAWAQMSVPVQATSAPGGRLADSQRIDTRNRSASERIRNRTEDSFASAPSAVPVKLLSPAVEALDRVTTADVAARSQNESNLNRR